MYDNVYHNQPINQTSFLITGGAGFIGSNIAHYLLKHGAKKVRVLDNFLTGRRINIAPFLEHPAFELLEGSIEDIDICHEACDGINAITHQAALGSVPRSVKAPLPSHSINSTGFLNMLEAARNTSIKRFVFASSSSVYGDNPTLPKTEQDTGTPLSPYAITKVTNELYAKVYHALHDIEIMGLRYFNVFGPNQDPNGVYAAVIPKFIQKIKDGTRIDIHGNGEQTRDFTYVENAVQANIRALTTSNEAAFGEVFNVAVGANFSVNTLVNAIQMHLDCKAFINFTPSRAGDIPNSLANISKSKTLLDYNPLVTFNDGLGRTIKYFNELVT